MSQHLTRLFPTPKGLSLAGTIIAKRRPNGLFELDNKSYAQIQAAYGRPISPREFSYITHACAELAKVSTQELDYASYPVFPSPHGKITQNHEYTPLMKGLMLLALSGLNDLPNPAQGRARLLKMQADKSYNPNQPRVPAGHGKESGEWTSGNDSDVDSDDDNDDLGSGLINEDSTIMYYVVKAEVSHATALSDYRVTA